MVYSEELARLVDSKMEIPSGSEVMQQPSHLFVAC